ncbi:MAG TPA: CHAD domain-containing protein [Ktedonobacterales bacterium]
MEIEAKFALTEPVAPERIDGLALAPYTLRQAGVERHTDTLLDTPTCAVTRTLHGLRVRAIGSRRILTLKGPNRGASGVYEREEIEVELAGEAPNNPREWPPEIGAPTLALVGDEPLAPLFRVRVERRLWHVRQGRRLVAELALDEGEIEAGGRREPIHELEVELKGSGAREDLAALDEALRAALPLRLEPRSKLQRGLALVRRARWSLDGATPLEAVGRHAVHKHLRAMLAARRDVIERGDPDAIHDMRVATRRIRTTLQAFEGLGVFPERTLRSLRRRLRKDAALLGAVRDTDIFLDRIRAWVGDDDARERDLEPLRDLLAEGRAASYERLINYLTKAKHARLIADLWAFTRPPSTLSLDRALTRHAAGTIIWPRYEATLRFETLLGGDEPATLHRLRIACKRLRYALEVFAPQLGAGVTPLRKALVAAQSGLGEIQDITIALGLVTRLGEAARERAGLLAFAQTLREERAERMRQVDALWRPLAARGAREALSEALAAL